MIESELREVCALLGHSPTHAELLDMGQRSLARAIKNSGGLFAWAERVGIPRIQSDSDFGWAGEIRVANILSERGFSVVRSTAVKAPYDLLVNGALRVDVKTANFARYGPCAGWFYRIGKIPTADLMFLLQMDTGEFYPLPWYACPSTNVTISRSGGKYSYLRNNWDLIHAMADIRTAELQKSIAESIEEVA